MQPLFSTSGSIQARTLGGKPHPMRRRSDQAASRRDGESVMEKLRALLRADRSDSPDSVRPPDGATRSLEQAANSGGAWSGYRSAIVFVLCKGALLAVLLM